jgi:uncharacterized membrane protein YoaK (UPF0700 family)
MSGTAIGAHRSKVAYLGGQLALLSFGSGCMDILSYRELGAVFTSAMTGNTALLGLEIGQGNFPATSRNMAAFAGFLLGLLWGAAILRREQGKPGWSGAVTRALTVEAMLLLVFTWLWIGSAGPVAEPTRYALIALSAIAMGIQSAAAHAIGVPGITTTYFTGTITNIVVGAVGRTASREPPKPDRRKMRWLVTALSAYVLGAALAGLLATHHAVVPSVAPRLLPALVVFVVLGAAALDARRVPLDERM